MKNLVIERMKSIFMNYENGSEGMERKFRNLLIRFGYGSNETKFSMVLNNPVDLNKIVPSKNDFTFKEAIRIRENLYSQNVDRYINRRNLSDLIHDINYSKDYDIFCLVFQKRYHFDSVGYIFYRGGNKSWPRKKDAELLGHILA